MHVHVCVCVCVRVCVYVRASVFMRLCFCVHKSICMYTHKANMTLKQYKALYEYIVILYCDMITNVLFSVAFFVNILNFINET